MTSYNKSLSHALNQRVLGSSPTASTTFILGRTEEGAGGEIQLTDAMVPLIGHQPFNAVTFAGRRFDCGSKAGFVEATLALALQREDLGDEVLAIARRLVAETDLANAVSHFPPLRDVARPERRIGSAR